MITSKHYEPLGAQLQIVGEVADTTAKGILAYPGVETTIGQTEVTYADNAKTITSIDSDTLGFVVSANTNLFVGQCIKLGTVAQPVVVTAIDSLNISVDREILTTVLATEAVTESAYYSAHRMDKDAKSTDSTKPGWFKDYRYFYLELKNGSTAGRQDVITPQGFNVADYVVDSNISTKPISMLKINASNVVTPIYFYKAF